MKLKPDPVPGYEWRFSNTTNKWRKYKILDEETAVKTRERLIKLLKE